MTHMLMGLAQGKLVVCLEVRAFLRYKLVRPLAITDHLPGWLQSHINLEVGSGSNANSHR